jgi:hypothetical protein
MAGVGGKDVGAGGINSGHVVALFTMAIMPGSPAATRNIACANNIRRTNSVGANIGRRHVVRIAVLHQVVKHCAAWAVSRLWAAWIAIATWSDEVAQRNRMPSVPRTVRRE